MHVWIFMYMSTYMEMAAIPCMLQIDVPSHRFRTNMSKETVVFKDDHFLKTFADVELLR